MCTWKRTHVEQIGHDLHYSRSSGFQIWAAVVRCCARSVKYSTISCRLYYGVHPAACMNWVIQIIQSIQIIQIIQVIQVIQVIYIIQIIHFRPEPSKSWSRVSGISDVSARHAKAPPPPLQNHRDVSYHIKYRFPLLRLLHFFYRLDRKKTWASFHTQQ